MVDSLPKLNIDVLAQIFEHLCPKDGLRALSMTCKSMREATIPMLFESCVVCVKKPIATDCFIPQALWPFVRSLHLTDDCWDLVHISSPLRESNPTFTNDRLLCGTMDATFLRSALRAMPHLRSVRLSHSGWVLHGIDWDPLGAILSTPHLREFTLAQYLLSPRRAPTASDIETIAPIASFRCDRRGSRQRPFKYPPQEETLRLVLQRLRSSVEDLVLPIELTSLRLFSDNQWPQLRTLHLKGVFRPDPSSHIPFVCIFSGMPNLRIVNLELALRPDVDSQLLHLWPRGHTAPQLPPWENLEDLTISFPHQDDQIYTHLPHSLRRLSLRCSPHYCIYTWHGRCSFVFQYPFLHASELLEILRRVDAPHLDHLQVEYHTDTAEDELLRHISEKFPHLSSLEMHRYPQPDDEDLPVAMVAERLAGLRNLHILHIHLHFSEQIKAYKEILDSIDHEEPSVDDFIVHDDSGSETASENEYNPSDVAHRAMLMRNATIIASRLPQQDLQLWLLEWARSVASWRLFRIKVSLVETGDQTSRVEAELVDHPGVTVDSL